MKTVAFIRFAGYGYNGYVMIPPEHPLYGANEDKLDDEINVHGGVTFAEYLRDCEPLWLSTIELLNSDGKLPLGNVDWYIVGFDTMHFGDIGQWLREDVVDETLNMQEQLEELIKK